MLSGQWEVAWRVRVRVWAIDFTSCHAYLFVLSFHFHSHSYGSPCSIIFGYSNMITDCIIPYDVNRPTLVATPSLLHCMTAQANAPTFG